MDFLLLSVILGLILFVPYKKFRDTKYEEVSGNGFFDTMSDKDNYGEYVTFSILQNHLLQLFL
ncbi:hypothetical protein ACFFHM_01670 [Halalkalibacter kiskunsagensis]|uniref:Uncharacterized protein n=1 Tax=Halalkalibacter kiskunsagensis TaxID=1548599 RepID=A0ABV6K7J7_9BACI